MLNYLWAIMILVGVLYGAVTGNMQAITNAAIQSAGEAVSLCITMVGVMSFWVGLMEIAQKSGLISRMTKGIQPFISFMFPKIPQNHISREYIATNLIANIMGLGWAATPAGLRAMEELSQLEQERRKEKAMTTPEGLASNEMCTFLVLNISSLQLIPVNMIAYRSQYGSVNPAVIVGAGIVATLVSTVVAVAYCKVKTKRAKCTL